MKKNSENRKNRRAYMRSEVAIERLRAHFAAMLKSGNTLLPSECELSRIVGCSRVTLRRLLPKLEEDGTLSKGPRGRSISVTPKNGPSVVFTATGVGVIGNMTWSRVWHSLSTLAAGTDLNLSLLLTEISREEETYAPVFASPPDYLIIADCTGQGAKEKLFQLKEQSVLIAVDENDSSQCEYAACVDNFEAGRLAARTLLEAGYRNPCYLGMRHQYEYCPFLKRAEGFFSELHAAGIGSSPDAERWVDSKKKRTLEIRDFIHESEVIASSSFDSLFLYSDEEVQLVYEIISEQRDIPDDFGLVTMRGRGFSIQNKPAITALDQAEEGIANGILRLIDTLRKGSVPEPGIVYAGPRLIYGGETVSCRT